MREEERDKEGKREREREREREKERLTRENMRKEERDKEGKRVRDTYTDREKHSVQRTWQGIPRESTSVISLTVTSIPSLSCTLRFSPPKIQFSA